MTEVVNLAKPATKLKITVRTSDGQTAKFNGDVDSPLSDVLADVTKKLNIVLAGNQVAYFTFEGTRYDIAGKRLGDIVGLKTDDQIGLLVETRAG